MVSPTLQKIYIHKEAIFEGRNQILLCPSKVFRPGNKKIFPCNGLLSVFINVIEAFNLI